MPDRLASAAGVGVTVVASCRGWGLVIGQRHLLAVERRGDEAGGDGQHPLVEFVVGDRHVALDRQHTDQHRPRDHRCGELAAGVGEAGEPDLVGGLAGGAVDRAGVRQHPLEIGDARRLLARRGEADHALAEGDLGAGAARLVAVAGERDELAEFRFVHEQQRVGGGEQFADPGERGVDHLLEFGHPGQAIAVGVERGEGRRRSLRRIGHERSGA